MELAGQDGLPSCAYAPNLCTSIRYTPKVRTSQGSLKRLRLADLRFRRSLRILGMGRRHCSRSSSWYRVAGVSVPDAELGRRTCLPSHPSGAIEHRAWQSLEDSRSTSRMVVACLCNGVRGRAWDRLVKSGWAGVLCCSVCCYRDYRFVFRMACRSMPLRLALCGLPQSYQRDWPFGRDNVEVAPPAATRLVLQPVPFGPDRASQVGVPIAWQPKSNRKEHHNRELHPASPQIMAR